MTLLELYDKCEGRGGIVRDASVPYKSKEGKRTCTLEELNAFKKLLSFDEIFLIGLKETEDFKEFYEAFELMREVTPPEIREDVFYAAKVNYIVAGVPSKLVYLLKKALKVHDTPNVALSAIDMRILPKFLADDVLPAGITIKMIMEDILGYSVRLLSEYQKCIKFKDSYEVYVANSDRVLILPEWMGSFVQTQKDIDNIHYVEDVGVCLYEQPMRTLGGRYGITCDEYDLRRVL